MLNNQLYVNIVENINRCYPLAHKSTPISLYFLPYSFFSHKMVLTLITFFFYCVLSLSSSQIKADTCDTYNHPEYGIGRCMHQSQCSNSLYVSGLCESQSSNIKCCFSLNDTVIEEFRAVWIATVNNMDWPSSNTASPAQQQLELIQILDTVQQLNMNAVVFHVIRKNNCFVMITNKDIFICIGLSNW